MSIPSSGISDKPVRTRRFYASRFRESALGDAFALTGGRRLTPTRLAPLASTQDVVARQIWRSKRRSRAFFANDLEGRSGA